MRLLWKPLALLVLGLCSFTLARGQEPQPPVVPPVADSPDEVEDLLKKIPPDTPPDVRERYKEMIKRYVEERKRGGIPEGPGFTPPGGPASAGFGGTTRLGVEVQTPPAALVEQLDLPKDQGLLIGKVDADSAAAKAGLKSYDVILELDGKPVKRDLSEFNKSLGALKEDAKVSLVVLRKGKNETIKELALVKAQPRGPGFPRDGFRPAEGFPMPPDGVRPPEGVRPPDGFPPMPPGGRDFIPMPGGEQGVITTVFRTGDRFTARHQEGSLIITLTGEHGKVKEIKVHDGREGGSYESVDKTPNAYRDKVRNLVDMIEKTNVKIEIKEPKKEEPKKEPEK